MTRKLFALLLTTLCLISYSELTAQTTLPTFWTFVNPSPDQDSTAAPNGWLTKLDIRISGSTPYIYSSGSDNNASLRLDETGEYVKVSFTDKPGQISFYAKGTGFNPNPAFSGSFTVQESKDGANWTILNTYTALTNKFVRYTDQPSADSRHIRFYYTDKQSGSNLALDSVYIAAPLQQAEASIKIKQGISDVANGAKIIIGNDSVQTFMVSNAGSTDTLFIYSASFSGANANDYSISGMPAYVLADASTSFQVHFKPLQLGSRLANLSILNSDADKSDFKIQFYGIGGKYASEPISAPSNLSFTDIEAYGFQLNFDKPAQAPENFIILRSDGSPNTATPVDGVHYEVGDKIGNSTVAMISSANAFRPNYILANSKFEFSVFSFNGPQGFENYLITSNLSGSVVSKGKNYGSYYSGLDMKNSKFLENLSSLINRHDTIFYSNYSTALIENFLARDTTGGRKVVDCVYTGISTPYNKPFIWWGNGTGGTLTREHTYAQSWMPSNKGGNWPNDQNGKELPEYNDLHHLYPADQILANVKRSNLPFGEIVGTPEYVSPTGKGKIGKNQYGETVWEPEDSHKGDLARALFYMCTAYNGIAGNNWALPSNQREDVLKKWHKQDLPSALEIARHELIYTLQKNRNPFIDSIEFADKIDFSNMTYSGDTSASFSTVSKKPSIKVYPNPSHTGIFTIELNKPQNLILYDALGKLLLIITNKELTFTLDLSNKAAGLYFLKTEEHGIFKLLIEK